MLVSGILGSLAGLFGTIGWIMKFSEQKIEAINGRLEKKRMFNKVKKRRKEFKAGLANTLDTSTEVALTERQSEPESKRLALV